MNLFNEEVLGRVIQVYDSPKEDASKLHKLVVNEVIDCHTVKGILLGTNIEVTYHMPDGMNIQILDSPKQLTAEEKYLGRVVNVYTRSGKKKLSSILVGEIRDNGKVIAGVSLRRPIPMAYTIDMYTLEVVD